jgi:hypothetical protein
LHDRRYLVEMMGEGVAIGNFDNDGLPDMGMCPRWASMESFKM